MKILELFLLITIIYIIYIFFYNKKIKKKDRLKKIKIQSIRHNYFKNNYLENYGKQLKKPIPYVKNVKLNFNLKANNKISTIQDTELNSKIINIITGRFKISENYIIEKISHKVKEYLNLLTETYKYKLRNVDIFNEFVDKITLEICRYIIDDINDSMKIIMISQYIIKYTTSNDEIEYMYNKITEIASKNNINEDVRMNAIDVLLLSNNTKYNNIAKPYLNQIRNKNTKRTLYENKIKNIISISNKANNINNINNIQIQNLNTELNEILNIPDIDVPPLIQNKPIKLPEYSIYEDRQNVHNNSINETTLNIASELIKKYSPLNPLTYTHYRINLNENDILKVEESIHRINTDTSKFKYDISLYKLYQSVLQFIEKHKDKEELYKRLVEELIDMHKKCVSGHLARLVSVVQGFETDFSNQVSNIDHEIYAKIKHIIEKEIQESDNMDNIIEDMLSDNKEIYYSFIKQTINKHKNSLYEEYQNIKDKNVVFDSILKNLNKYTRSEGNFKDLTI